MIVDKKGVGNKALLTLAGVVPVEPFESPETSWGILRGKKILAGTIAEGWILACKQKNKNVSA